MTLFQRQPCDDCSSFDFSCTGRCRKFGVKLRVTRIKPPVYFGQGTGVITRRDSVPPEHPESIPNWVRTNLGIEPEDWMWK